MFKNLLRSMEVDFNHMHAFIFLRVLKMVMECIKFLRRCFEQGRYRRMDRFQEDMFEVFKYARKASRTDSQLYEDSADLQKFFIQTREQLCKNGDLLLTPALSYQEMHLLRDLEVKKKQNKNNRFRDVM